MSTPGEQGLHAALRLERIAFARERVRRLRAERELASFGLDIARDELHRREWESENGIDYRPPWANQEAT